MTAHIFNANLEPDLPGDPVESDDPGYCATGSATTAS